MCAENVASGLVEGVERERPRTGPDVRSQGGRADVRAHFFDLLKGARGPRLERRRAEREDAVFVGFAEGAVARMEYRRDDFRAENADAGRQAAVQGSAEVGGWNGGRKGKGRNLAKRVDAGVGATGALGKDALACSAMDCIREQPLDGRQAGLDLPSMVGCPVIGEDELPLLHGDALHGNTGGKLSVFS